EYQRDLLHRLSLPRPFCHSKHLVAMPLFGVSHALNLPKPVTVGVRCAQKSCKRIVIPRAYRMIRRSRSQRSSSARRDDFEQHKYFSSGALRPLQKLLSSRANLMHSARPRVTAEWLTTINCKQI